MERFLQSHEQFPLDESVHVNVIHTKLPHGGMNRWQKYVDFEKYLRKKEITIQIKTKDELCAARALVVPKTRIDKNPYFKSIANSTCSRQEQMAHKLHADAGVPLGRCGIEEIEQFQTYLTDYQINIVSKDQINAIIYAGPKQDKKLYLLCNLANHEFTAPLQS